MRNPYAKAVIFDLGRVLVSYSPEPIILALTEISQADGETIKNILLALTDQLNLGKIDASAFHQHMIRHAGTTSDGTLFQAAACAGLAPIPAGLKFLRELRKRHPPLLVGVISNTNQVHARWLYANLPELATLDSVILSPEVGLAKPDPAIFHLSVQQLDIQPNQGIFLDDLPENITAARQLGMLGIVHESWPSSRRAIEGWMQQHVAPP